MSDPATKPTVKLIALDVDGTLLRPDRTISPRVADAVRRAAERVPVVLASARPPRSLRSMHAELGLGSPQVNYNGALVWDRHESRAISHSPMTPQIVSALIAGGREVVRDAVVTVEHVDRWYTDGVDARFVTETGRLFSPDFVGPLSAFADLGATKLMLHAVPSDIDRLRASLELRFGGHVAFIRTDPDLLQMMKVGVGKWRTLVALAESLGVLPGEIMAVGDNENDVEMIANAGVGVAMANGTPEACVAARWIAPSNVDDGVAAAIERFVLTAS